MNKLKTIGLTALGTTLIASSAFAAELSVSGGASLYFDDTNRGKAAKGNSFYMGDSITFSGSGEMDNGMTAGVKYEIDNGALDDHHMYISSDAIGTIRFDGHGGSSAFSAVDDVAPQAYEESWDIIAEGDDNVINGLADNNMFKWTSPSVAGATLTMAYLDASDAVTDVSYSDYAIAFSPEMVEGLTLGYAAADVEVVTGTKHSESTMYAKYAYGPVTVGYQTSDQDKTAANTDVSSVTYGISYAVSDNMSVAYHQATVDTEADTDDQEATGISVSYTMGSMTLKAAHNTVDNVAGASAADRSAYDLSLAFAF